MKRIISFFIAAVLLFSMTSVAVVAKEEKTAYQVVYEGLLDCQEQINVYDYGLDGAALVELMEEVLKNEPMLFHVASSYRYSYVFGGIVYAVLPQYDITGSEYDDAKDFVNTEIEAILSCIPENLDDYEKTVYLHDYLCVDFAYDINCDIYDIYNMLKNHNGVCMAYSLLYDELLTRIGIESRAIVSPSDSLNHMWNEIEIDGTWYEVDITWDDPLVNGNDVFGRACHINYLLSDEAMHKSHNGTYNLDYSCTCTDFDSIAWDYIDTPFGFVDGDMYMLDGNIISQVDFYTGESEEIYTVANQYWFSIDDGCLGYRIGFGSYNDKLYYNSKTEIKRYDPVSEIEQIAYTPDSSEGIIIGMYIVGNTVHYLASPTGYADDATEHTYVIDENSVTMPHEHTPGDEATCTTPQICTECKMVLVDELGHTEGEWKTIKEAEKGVEGLKELRCSVCGELLDSEIIDALEDEPEPEPEPEPEIMLGDVNDDSVVSSIDYIMLKRSCFGTYVLSDEEKLRGDVDQNNTINSTDYICVKRIVFGTYTVSNNGKK